MDRRPDVLCRTDDHCEGDEEQNGVAVMQPINHIVIVARRNLDDAGQSRKQAVDHRGHVDCRCCDHFRSDTEASSLVETTEVDLFRTTPTTTTIRFTSQNQSVVD